MVNQRMRQSGFTLTEAVMVIVITGILASMVAVFIQGPVQGYFDTTRRAQLADTADTALRRISRDLQAALPNSVRVTGNCGVACYLEFIPVIAGGRYRADFTDIGTGDLLDFTIADTAFDVIGPPLSLPAGGLWVAIYSLGIPGADAYSGEIRRQYAGAAGAISSISITSAAPYPFESPSKRFHVVTQPVTYECAPGAGVLRRYSGYGFNATQSAGAPAGSPALLANDVSACGFAYAAQEISGRAGLVSMTLSLTSEGETTSLFSQVHVSNAP
jgi:MSHA biogenesis protein MshO